jgi:Holliday junction DNA helicase RuvB
VEEKEIKTDVNQYAVDSIYQLKIDPTIRELLHISIDSYFQNKAKDPDNCSYGPLALLGPSGCGKSLIAKAVHSTLLNQHLIEANGESLNSIPEITAVLMTATNETTVFIDEAQALNSKAQHLLLTGISEKKIYAPRRNSKGKFAIPLANFSLILASTHEFQLQDALRNRMRLCCRLDYYSIEDLTDIVKQRAEMLGWKYESIEVLKEIASRSKQVPRLAINRNLQMAQNVSMSKGNEVISMQDALQALKLLQVDHLGLDQLERNYLKELSKQGKMKLNVLASKLGLPRNTISSVIEPYLLRTELMIKDGSDRAITEKGKSHIENCQV